MRFRPSLSRGTRFWPGWAISSLAVVLSGGCDKPPTVKIPVAPKVEQLVVVTPHDEMIRSAFESAFSEWHKDNHDSYVEIRWIAAGTPQCVEYVEEAGRPDFVRAERPIPDVLFGGGPLEHQKVADQGLSQAVDLTDVEVDMPASIVGTATRDPQNRWHSSALSSFGLLVAAKACRERGIPAPTSWRDLADPRFYGWMAVADPERSGSNRLCLITILEKYGWDEGWGIIMRILANCRALSDGSGEVISNVTTGMCLAGFCVNFSALRQIEERGEETLTFVVPSDANVITPDPVSVLTFAQNHVVGEQFARFCVSDEGQKTWGFKAQLRGGHNDTLFRYPINPTFYTEHKDSLGVADNPYEMPSILAVDQQSAKKRSKIIGPLVRAACGENHVILQRCWRKVIDGGMNTAALEELLKPIVSESEAHESYAQYQKGGEAAEVLMRKWATRFREKYRRVEAVVDASG